MAIGSIIKGLFFSIWFWLGMIVVLFLFFKIKRFFYRGRKKVTIEGNKILYTKNNFAKSEIITKELDIYNAYDYFDDKKGWRQIPRKIKEFFMVRWNYANVIGINMQLESGRFIEFLIPINNTMFRYGGGRYVIDEELKYDKANSKFFWLDYHENFAIPIKREINIKVIKESLELSNIGVKIKLSTNPKVLEALIIAEIAQQVLSKDKSQETLLMIIGIINILLTIFIAWKVYGIKIT